MLTPPIPVVLPLAAAALLAVLNRRIPQWLATAIAILTSVLVAMTAVSLAVYTRYDPIVYWFGGWTPRGTALGISFVVDDAGAMLVLLGSVLVTAALVFSWHYFDTVGTLYQVLMLMFLAAVGGFSETGDLFNLFVFFELMSVSAYALCGYQSEEPGPLQAAMNFAVTNTIGGFLILTGIALLYGRTGALNMAQIGRTLGTQSDSLVVAAFAFLVCGFFVKAAIVPFHFWLADAHAAAPAPVCAIFSGIMVELGLYAVVRIYWTIFSGPLAPHQNELRTILEVFGVVTALFGALMCFLQRHLKRMLAFSTISHMGMLLLGVALLTPEGLAGACINVVGHAMLKGGLFLAAGILLHRTGTVDEIHLTARVRHLRWVGGLFFVGAAGLAGMPPFGTFWGETMIAASARELGQGWVEWVSAASAAIASAALFRFAGRVFLRWGPPAGEIVAAAPRIREKRDTKGNPFHTPASMHAAAAGLIVLGALAGLAPRLTGAAEAAALHIQNRQAYAERVLDGLTPYPPTVHDQPATPGDVGRSFGIVLAGALLAAITLVSAPVRRSAVRLRVVRRAIHELHALHSGILPDYVAWLMFGLAAFGSAAYLWLRVP